MKKSTQELVKRYRKLERLVKYCDEDLGYGSDVKTKQDVMDKIDEYQNEMNSIRVALINVERSKIFEGMNYMNMADKLSLWMSVLSIKRKYIK